MGLFSCFGPPPDSRAGPGSSSARPSAVQSADPAQPGLEGKVSALEASLRDAHSKCVALAQQVEQGLQAQSQLKEKDSKLQSATEEIKRLQELLAEAQGAQEQAAPAQVKLSISVSSPPEPSPTDAGQADERARALETADAQSRATQSALVG